jgi:large subunit ribosomal protein L4
MDLKVLDIQGKETSKTVSLSDSIFGLEPNEHAIYLDVKAHLAAKRQGTHKAKERAEIAGSTRKIKKQKGTGTARAGSIKSPLFKGGGRVFGPEPRDYTQKLNKKLRKVARRSALSAKAKDGEIIVLQDLAMEAPKTQEYVKILNALGINDKKSVLVIAEQNKNVYLSSRNLKGAKVVTASELSTYDTMNAYRVIITESAVGKIEETLS